LGVISQKIFNQTVTSGVFSRYLLLERVLGCFLA
jgi:hypothetical protein